MCRRVESAHLSELTPIHAFQRMYQNKELETLDLYSAEFNAQLELQAALPTHAELDITNPNDCLLSHSYTNIKQATLAYLDRQRPENVPLCRLENFINALFREYKFVPYHNFAHGVSVMQFFHSFVSRLPDQSAMFDQTHIFVGLIAALAHDVGHSGKNNAYNCTKGTKLALKSLNKAVLEKLHIKKTLYLLKQADSNLFCNFSQTEVTRANQLIVETILATDMAEHFNLVERFSKTKVSDFKKNDAFLTGYIVHAGDLGNLALDFTGYAAWAKLIVQEFQSQTDSERRNQLKESEFMKFKGRESFVRDQLSFASELIRHLCASPIQIC